MQTKVFEIRDHHTFIPAVGILMQPHNSDLTAAARESFLLRRAGYHFEQCVVLCRMECAGTDRNATYDPFAWGDRTMHTAHLYITEHWPELASGAVIDVAFILGETREPKTSESKEHPLTV